MQGFFKGITHTGKETTTILSLLPNKDTQHWLQFAESTVASMGTPNTLNAVRSSCALLSTWFPGLNYLLWLALRTNWTLLHKLHSLTRKWRYLGSDKWSNFTVRTPHSHGLALRCNLQPRLKRQSSGSSRLFQQATSKLREELPKLVRRECWGQGHSHPSFWSFATG